MTDPIPVRLRAHRLVGAPFASAVDAVRWLGAVQSQDYPAAKWGLGQRLGGAIDADLDRLFDAGAILRTHVMRPTWHFVLPEDSRWLQELTAARVMRLMAGRHRALELDDTTVARAGEAFGRALAGGRAMTRPELGEVLRAAGISPEGQRLPHLLATAELAALITSGPRRGKVQTFALLSDRAPNARSLDREEALAELTLRYFRGHGPAQARDFGWWSGLTAADIRRGLELVGRQLEHEVLDGREHWFDAGAIAGGDGDLVAHLLPNFDEFTVGYRDRGALLRPGATFDPALFAYFRESTPESGLLSNIVTTAGRVRGSWRRTLTPKELRVEIRLFEPLDASEAAAVEAAGRRLGRFLDRPLAINLA